MPSRLPVRTVPRPPADRLFGIEFEFASPLTTEALGDALTSRLKTVIPLLVVHPSYRHTTHNWDLKLDASCGYELASPPLTLRSWGIVEELLKTFSSMRPPYIRLNEACSYHVHHDVRHLTSAQFGRLFKLWVAVEPLTMLCVPWWRRESSYALPLRLRGASWEWTNAIGNRAPGGIRSLLRDLFYTRRVSMNILPYWRTGTVEFRSHHATYEAGTLWWWVVFTQGLIALASRRFRAATLRRLHDAPTTEDRIAHLLELSDGYLTNPHREVFQTIFDRVEHMREIDQKVPTNPASYEEYRMIHRTLRYDLAAGAFEERTRACAESLD